MHCSSFNEFRNKNLDNLDIVLNYFNVDNHSVNDETSGNNSSIDCLSNSNNVNNNGVNENFGVNNLSVNASSNNRSKIKCTKVFNFLLGGRRNNNNNKTEWENLCKCQLKSGNLSEIPFLAKTAAFFNSIMPIVTGQRWSLINSHSTKVTKSANAENTVRQASSASVHIRAYAHATERNRDSLSGSQTQ